MLPSQDMRLPFTLDILHTIVDSLKRLHSSWYHVVMYKAIYLLAFHALLRVGEYTVRGSERGHTLSQDDIHFSVKNNIIQKLLIRMRHYKHSKNPVTLSLSPLPVRQYCPVLALASYLSQRAPVKGPLFLGIDNSPLTTAQFSSVLKMSVIDAGLDPSKYKPHSFRIGGTTRAHELNLSESKIQEIGRWRSSSYRRYIRIPLVPLT